jgi:hypothetical protein
VSGRAFLFACAGLIAVRMSLGAHAPALVDAHACLVALALCLVGRASRPAVLVASLVVGAAALSILASWDPWISFLALPAALGPAAFFLLASSTSWRAPLLAGLGLGGALNAVAAHVQHFITWPDAMKRMDQLGLDAATVQRLAEARALGLSVSPDLAAGLCAMGAFGAIALLLDVKDARARAALGLLAAISASGLLVTRSFGTAIALALGVGTSALVLALQRSRRTGLVVGAGGAVVAAAALGVAFAVRGADALSRSAGERVENWQAAWRLLVEHPLLGVGFMRFPAAYLEARAPGSNLTRYAHSTPLEHLAETGVVGGALAIAAVIIAARALWRRRQSLTSSDAVILGAAAATVFRLVVDYDGHVAQTASVAGVIFGLLLATDEPAPAPTSQRRAVAALAAVSAILVFVLVWRDAALQSDDDAALASYSARFPFDVEPRLARAAKALDQLAVCSSDDDCRDARVKIGAALDDVCTRTHPPSAALLLRGRARLITHDPAGAVVDADAALRVDPGSAAAHQLGIAAAHARGDDDAAVAARVEAAQRWGVSPP